MRRSKGLEFLKNIPETDECVLWPFHCRHTGYGVVRQNGHHRSASRVSLTIATGIDPAGMFAAHGPCHNRRCVNPRHLSWKSRKGNEADKLRDGTSNRGDKHGKAKLTEPEVMAIRNSRETREVLAKRYGVTKWTISDIRQRKRWAWL